jgi:hypothetical protein
MSTTALRQIVIERADNCCEYCLLSQRNSFLPFEVDHIIALKHEGETESENLCLSCPSCNRFKGSNIASLDQQTRLVVPLFNPRTQSWSDHFKLSGAVIEPLTPQGRVTVKILRMNNPEQIAEREGLISVGSYPCPRPAESSAV